MVGVAAERQHHPAKAASAELSAKDIPIRLLALERNSGGNGLHDAIGGTRARVDEPGRSLDPQVAGEGGHGLVRIAAVLVELLFEKRDERRHAPGLQIALLCKNVRGASPDEGWQQRHHLHELLLGDETHLEGQNGKEEIPPPVARHAR